MFGEMLGKRLGTKPGAVPTSTWTGVARPRSGRCPTPTARLISMMVLARNAAALRADVLRRDRTLVFLSRRELRRRYGFARDVAA